MKKVNVSIIFASFVAPFLAAAQTTGSALDISFFTTLIAKARQILESIIPIIITLMIVFFLWSLFRFIQGKSAGDESKLKLARTQMIWSLVAFFLAISFMGIVRLAQSITGVKNGPGANIQVTDVPTVAF